MSPRVPTPFLCWSTDGDNIRRHLFDALMCNKLSVTSPLYRILSKLLLLDLETGDNEETVDFDAKHLAKRTRNSMIKKSFSIGKVSINNSDMTKILEKGVMTSTRHSVQAMMNPKDKQNVGPAVQNNDLEDYLSGLHQ